MEIAKGYSDKKFLSLDLTGGASEDWATAIEIFRLRFFSRYIEPANALIKAEELISPADKKYGFAITAIDCLLIETLACFYSGATTTPSPNAPFYTSFMIRPGTELSKHFNAETAGYFYDQIRCGILHQSETKRESLIRSVGPAVVKKDESIIINRNKLHEVMQKEFELYIERLKDPANTTLRDNFVKKMRFICRA